MNTKLIAGSTVSGLVIAGGIAGMVSAQSVADATNLTEEQIIEIAMMEIPGEVTEVELESRRGNQIFDVEVIAENGEEMDLMIDAVTGEILKVKAESAGCDDDDGSEEDDNTEEA